MESELRDRIVRLETELSNAKENFSNFKREEFAALKSEVHTMRSEFNAKLDLMLEKISALGEIQSKMKIELAKYAGGVAVLFWLAQYIIPKLLGGG